MEISTEAPVAEALEAVQKKPRSVLQQQALERARHRALEIRTQKAQKPAEAVPEESVAETTSAPQEEIEYVKRHRSKPKAKKRILVVEESSDSEEEVEVRLPRRRSLKVDNDAPRDFKFEKAYHQMFSNY